MIETVVLLNNEIAIKLREKYELFIKLDVLRLGCPCAWCCGETDVFGNKYVGPSKKLEKKAFQIFKFEKVGLYGVRFFWKDGHKDGIYTFKLLETLSKHE